LIIQCSPINQSSTLVTEIMYILRLKSSRYDPNWNCQCMTSVMFIHNCAHDTAVITYLCFQAQIPLFLVRGAHCCHWLPKLWLLHPKCHNCACLTLGYAHASRRRALDKLSTVPAGEHGEPYQNQFNRILQDCLVSACQGK
jgi:hypothetical protein